MDFSLDTQLPELSVSQLSDILKRTVETAFSRIRLKGEISGFKLHTSGHMYFTLKDEQAVIDAVCWRGTSFGLQIKPEDGMAVIATGKLTIYPGRSKYQIVVESMEPAGEGALLKLLEDRKRKFAAEGLFDADRKKNLPFLPNLIGIITSPTGAVIRDILHRLEDRHPTHVIVWPVAVQGEGSAEQIAKAIKGFNILQIQPELLIVARGGGSLEDLWSFNEEIVVRAVADSHIPVISAVGHETDTTLIDFVADKRAPTPTAAAEFAVPVRVDLLETIAVQFSRLKHTIEKQLHIHQATIEMLRRSLPNLTSYIDNQLQRLDEWQERFVNSHINFWNQKNDILNLLFMKLKHPDQLIELKTTGLPSLGERLSLAIQNVVTRSTQQVESQGQLLSSYSVQHTLERGFILAANEEGHILTSIHQVKENQDVNLQLKDGRVLTKIVKKLQ